MRSCVPLTILLLVPALALAQQTTGSLEGRVVDASGQPIGGVEVEVTGSGLLGPRRVKTNDDGLLRVPALPVGRCEVSLRHAGHEELLLEHVGIHLGRTTHLGKITLSDRPEAMEEMVVRGAALEPATTEIGGHLSSDDLDNLPTERDHLAAAAYLPQVNTSFFGDDINVAGSTGAENAYFIDGVNVTDPHYAKGSMSLPQSFIRAIEVKVGGYQAEYGRSSGGIINVVTHSGSNEFEARAFGFFTNNDFADGRRVGLLELEQDDFSRYDFGASVGGPIVRDKLWYFAAYDPRIQTRDLQIPGLRPLEDRTVTHSFAAKLDWQIDPRSRLTFTALGDPSQRDRVGASGLISDPLPSSVLDPETMLGDVEEGAFAFSLDARRFLGETTLLEARAYRVDRRSKLSAASPEASEEPMLNDRRTGSELSGGFGGESDYATSRTGLGLKGTVYLGSHEVKAGLEYEDNHLDARALTRTPEGVPGVITQYANRFDGLFIDLDQENHHRMASAFVQDSWNVTNSLQLSAGLRWDGLSIVDFAGDSVREINDQFQPRAGFRYQMDASGSHQIFGSYGRFYEQLSLVTTMVHFGNYEQWVIFADCDPRTCTPQNPFVYDIAGAIAPAEDDLEGPHFDEFTLGYERPVAGARVSLRGIYRELKAAVEDSWTPTGLLLGNPGRGQLSHLPEPKREYAGLELSVQRRFRSSLLSASYVLSRNYGNYPGAFPSEARSTEDQEIAPHRSQAFWYPEQYEAGDGLLPNDRRHVLKVHGFYEFAFGLTAGGFFTWQSGTPLSDMVRIESAPPTRPIPSYGFFSERGDQGRMPSLWDVNLRFAYDLPVRVGSRSRLLLDVFHLFGSREAVSINQTRLNSFDPETREGDPNPLLGEVYAYQPPMTIRLGVETEF